MDGSQLKRSRAQIAVEFVIVYSLVLLIFIILFGVVVGQRASTLSAQQYSSMQLVTQDISAYIDQALIAGSGYNATLAIPASSNLQPYNLFVSSAGAVIANETLGKTNIRATAYSSARSIVINGTQASSYNGTILYNVPTYSGTISVSNVGGTVYIDVPTAGLATYTQSVSAHGAGNTEAFNFKNTSVDGITVPQSASLDKAWSGSSWTINTWFMDTHPPQTDTSRELIIESTGCISGMALANTSATHYSLGTYQWYSSGGACTNAGSMSVMSGVIPYNTWVMGTSVFSYNGAGGGYVEICVDARCANVPWSSSSPSNYSKYGYDFQINSNNCHLCGGWQIGGELTNVQMYSSALTQNQITQLYEKGMTAAPVNRSSIEGWWPLDGNTNDYSGNGNNGVQGYTLNYSNVAQVNVHLSSGGGAGSPGTIVGAASSTGNASVTGKTFQVSPITGGSGNATVFVTSNSTAGKVNVTINAFNYNTSLQSHLVGWWPLDEGYGSTVHDMSGNGNDGTFYNSSWGQFAGSSAFQAGIFNGQGSGTTGYGGSYINSSSSSVLKPVHMTVSAWVKPYSSTASMAVAGIGAITNAGSYYMSTKSDGSGSIGFGTYNGISSVYAASAPLTLNAWHYVVGTYNGTNASIYVDGKLSDSVPDSQLVYYLASAPFRIGNLLGYADWNGIISNVQVYNTGLGAQQIAQQYKKGITATPLSGSGLVGWWPLDGNTKDFSVYADDGIPVNVTFGNMQYAGMPSGLARSVSNFNGLNNYIDIGNPSDLQFGSGSKITVSAWIKIRNCTHDAIVGHGLDSYTFYAAPYGAACNLEWAESSVANIGPGPSIPENRWLNVVAVNYVGSNVTLYVNGVEYGPYPFSNTYAYTENLRIGSSKSDINGYIFNGSIANVQLYNTALTPQQVRQLYAQGLPLYSRVNVSLS